MTDALLLPAEPGAGEAAPADAAAAPREGTSRQRFLEAADEQFVTHGYDRCTIRAIAARAGTSLASLSRNWTSKRHLFEEVFKRHFDPIHAVQNEGFDALERAATVTVREIVAAFFGAALTREDAASRQSHRIYCMALLDPSDEARSITRPLVEPVRARMIALMRRALPQHDETRFFLAMNVVLGVYMYPQAHGERLAGVMGYDLAAIDWTAAVDVLAGMVSEGIATAA